MPLKKIPLSSNLTIIAALILGALTGYFIKHPWAASLAEGISTIFINFLRLISMPIVFLSIVSSISGMQSWDEMKTLGRKTIKYTLITTILAASVALLVYQLISPPITPRGIEPDAPLLEKGPSYFSFVSKIFPSNIITLFSDNSNIMGVVFLAFLLSFAILSLPQENKTTLHNFFSSLFAAIRKVTELIFLLMPFAVWAFIYLFVQEISTLSLKSLMLYFLCIVLANLIQGAIVLPLILKIKNISPLKTFKGMFPALLFAFFSKSSQATLPTTLKCARQNLKIAEKVTSFSLPICTAINMNGCAAFILTTVIYVASNYGIEFSLLDKLGFVFIASLAALGNAGIPSGCYFLSCAILTSLSVPLSLMGTILPLYMFIDMEETALNVWSDSCVTTIIDHEIKSHQK